METIELRVDDETAQRLRKVANDRHQTVEELLQETIAGLGTAAEDQDPFWGLFADDPDSVDQVVEMAMRSREERPWRAGDG